MVKKIEYKFDPQTKIYYKYYYGSVTVDDIISSWKDTFAKQKIPSETKGFILDYQNATFDLKIKEHARIAEFYSENIAIFGNYRIAIITTNPKDVVIPMLVSEKDDGYSSQPFSTHEAAIKWVLG